MSLQGDGMVAWTGQTVMAGERVRRRNDRSQRVLGSGGEETDRAPRGDGAAGGSEETFGCKHDEFEGFMVPPHGHVE